MTYTQIWMTHLHNTQDTIIVFPDFCGDSWFEDTPLLKDVP